MRHFQRDSVARQIGFAQIFDWQADDPDGTQPEPCAPAVAPMELFAPAITQAKAAGHILCRNNLGVTFDIPVGRYVVGNPRALIPVEPPFCVCPFGALLLTLEDAAPVWCAAVVRALGVSPEYFAGILHTLDETQGLAKKNLVENADYQAGEELGRRLVGEFELPRFSDVRRQVYEPISFALIEQHD